MHKNMCIRTCAHEHVHMFVCTCSCAHVRVHRVHMFFWPYVFLANERPHQKFPGGRVSTPIHVFCLICTVNFELNGILDVYH